MFGRQLAEARVFVSGEGVDAFGVEAVMGYGERMSKQSAVVVTPPQVMAERPDGIERDSIARCPGKE